MSERKAPRQREPQRRSSDWLDGGAKKLNERHRGAARCNFTAKLIPATFGDLFGYSSAAISSADVVPPCVAGGT